MLKKRWLAVSALTPAFICLGLFVFALVTAESRLTRGNFNRIKIGMPKAEVEEIISAGQRCRASRDASDDPLHVHLNVRRPYPCGVGG